MKDFGLTYDRHRGLYGALVRNFPESYGPMATPGSWTNDPDYVVKVSVKRFRVRWWIVGGLLLYSLIQWKARRVERYDSLKRKEQRAMQN